MSGLFRAGSTRSLSESTSGVMSRPGSGSVPLHPSDTVLVTGCAGFIGANLVLQLLRTGCRVVGIDNFQAGITENLDSVRLRVGDERWSRFAFIEGDISTIDDCRAACETARIVFHQAAISSPLEAEANPDLALSTNLHGTVNLLEACCAAGVERFIYASSCAVYGDRGYGPRAEDDARKPLNLYARTKLAVEDIAGVYARYMNTIFVGLRYFNCYGRFQSARPGQAAVIPAWIEASGCGDVPVIYGDGRSTRDFVHVDDVVNANFAAATAPDVRSGSVYNVGSGTATSLLDLFEAFREVSGDLGIEVPEEPRRRASRSREIVHSLADPNNARVGIGFRARIDLKQGLRATMEEWRRPSAVLPEGGSTLSGAEGAGT